MPLGQVRCDKMLYSVLLNMQPGMQAPFSNAARQPSKLPSLIKRVGTQRSLPPSHVSAGN